MFRKSARSTNAPIRASIQDGELDMRRGNCRRAFVYNRPVIKASHLIVRNLAGLRDAASAINAAETERPPRRRQESNSGGASHAGQIVSDSR
ncbi:hypothetical protein MRX96_003702 [Rhipicephalus microplus]